MSYKKTQNEKGFTLLEVILAVALLSIIGVMVINILTDQIKMRNELNQKNTGYHIVSSALEHISQDLQGAYLSSNDSSGSLNLIYRTVIPIFSYKDNNLILFIQNFQSLTRNSSESNQANIRYHVIQDPKNINKQKLVRIVDTDFVSPIDKDDIGISNVLIDDLESINIEFWDGIQFRKEWDSTTGDTQGLIPKLVKVKIGIYLPKPDQTELDENKEKKDTFKLETMVYLNSTFGKKQPTNAPSSQEYQWQ